MNLDFAFFMQVLVIIKLKKNLYEIQLLLEVFLVKHYYTNQKRLFLKLQTPRSSLK